MSRDIYKKIDAIFENELNQKPAWVHEILDELKQLNAKLEQHEQQEQKRDKAFYRFVKEFRSNMCADTLNSRYPKISHNNHVLGVNFKGLLYDVKSSKLLTTKEAFRVYESLYKQRDFEVFY